MFAILGQILVWLGRILPWLLKAAPWILTALNVLLSFWPAAQEWVAGLAANALPTVLGQTAMDMTELPISYLSQINTFIPLDLMCSSFTLFLPFYLSCLGQRMARATILAKSSSAP